MRWLIVFTVSLALFSQNCCYCCVMTRPWIFQTKSHQLLDIIFVVFSDELQRQCVFFMRIFIAIASLYFRSQIAHIFTPSLKQNEQADYLAFLRIFCSFAICHCIQNSITKRKIMREQYDKSIEFFWNIGKRCKIIVTFTTVFFFHTWIALYSMFIALKIHIRSSNLDVPKCMNLYIYSCCLFFSEYNFYFQSGLIAWKMQAIASL